MMGISRQQAVKTYHYYIKSVVRFQTCEIYNLLANHILRELIFVLFHFRQSLYVPLGQISSIPIVSLYLRNIDLYQCFYCPIQLSGFFLQWVMIYLVWVTYFMCYCYLLNTTFITNDSWLCGPCKFMWCSGFPMKPLFSYCVFRDCKEWKILSFVWFLPVVQ